MQPTADAITPDQNGLRAGVPPVQQNGEDFAQEPGGAAADGSSLDLAQLLDALQAMRTGDFSVRLPGNLTGRAGKVADTFNDIVSANQRMAQQLEHVGQVVGRDGKTRTRVKFGLTSGAWADSGQVGLAPELSHGRAQLLQAAF